MENFIDNMLDNIFGGVGSQINLIAGILLLIAGIVILISMKMRPSKGKNIAAWICIGIGALGFISGAVQLMLS